MLFNDFLFRWSIYCCKLGSKVFYYYCIAVYLFFKNHQWLFYIFDTLMLGASVYNHYILLLNWSLNHYVKTFVSCDSFWLNIFLTDINIANPALYFTISCNIFSLLYFQHMCVLKSKMSLIDSIYLNLVFYLFGNSIAFDWWV